VIAIRVFDFNGGEGVFGNIPSVKMLEPQDFITLKLVADENSINKYYASVTKTSTKTIEGAWTIKVKDSKDNKLVKETVKQVILKDHEPMPLS